MLAMAGCPDPQEQFDLFGERYKEIHGGGGGQGGTGGTGGTGGGGCVAPAEGVADGTYLFTLSAVLQPKTAFALDAQVTTVADGDGLSVDLVLQPLSKTDQMSPVGDPFSLTGLAVNADGTFDWDIGDMVTLIGDANPISPSDIETSLSLSGSLCAEPPDFFCGDANGIVQAPLPDFDLVGSTFTFQKYEGTVPSPLINCAKDPAEYEE